MKNYKQSDYAINKYSEAIEYRFADNKTVSITLEKYLAENPTKTADDYKFIKERSDQDYHATDKAENAQTYKNVSFHVLEETEECSFDSVEDTFINKMKSQKKLIDSKKIISEFLSCLTATQKERYLLYVCKGMPTRKIAEFQGVSQRTVMDSLDLVEKKRKKFLKDL